MGESSITSSGTKTKKKKKGFIRSLGKGLSFKKKKQRPDDESVIGVSLDRGGQVGGGQVGGGGSSSSAGGPPSARAAAPRSVAFSNDTQSAPRTYGGPSSSAASYSSGTGVGGSSSSPIAKPIQVVLLLMDPGSRRFELLQLEFDSNKALVSDVLRQIQCSATETTLRDMDYVGVSDQSGLEMISHMKLSRFCQGNDIVLAIPNGMSAKDTAKLAGPILGDPKVEDMLAPVGAKVHPRPAKKSKLLTSKLTKISEDGDRRKAKKDSSPRKGRSANGDGGGSAKRAEKGTPPSMLPTAALGVIVASMAFFAVQHHASITKPLESGDALYPGQWKSRCGVFDLLSPEWLGRFPFERLSRACDPPSSSVLELGRDGTLRYFAKGGDGQRTERWRVEGGGGGDQCEEDECDECCDIEATFMKEGNNWYVELDGTRASLNKDVIRDFAPGS
mmetsp:Transcript_40195/g.85581  ORF Transcript_40195/g.85581 Transcript_40195/m.85581 type:complete len:446 (+) Transcript_40195:199-1536(+)